MAGQHGHAFELYWAVLGGYKHLGQNLGDFGRGLRIVSGFAEGGVADEHQPAGRQRGILLAGWGLYAQNLGDTATARHVFSLQEKLHREHSDGIALSRCHRNFAYLELLAGRWAVALELTRSALAAAVLEDFIRYSHGHLAAALAGLGEVAGARTCLSKATTRSDDVQMWCMRVIQEVELSLRTTSDHTRGAELARECLRYSAATDRSRSEATSHCLLGHCCLTHDTPQGNEHLTVARAYASRTGNVEVALRCYHLAAEIARHEKDFSLAEAEALDGIQLADSCGFGRWSLDIRTELAKIHLAAGEPAKAVEPAEWVMKRSEEPDCQYAWGIADSLHLLGVAHARLGDKAKARDHLSRAVEKRRPLEHPGLGDTEAELARLG
jgi:tetratricopeptide (TPR) repeat protein